MKKCLLIFQHAGRRSGPFLAISLVCGIGLCVLMGYMAQLTDIYYGGISVGVEDSDNTVLSAHLQDYLTDTLGMELTESDDLVYLERELIDKRISAIVQIPQGFEADLLAGGENPLIVSSTDDYENAAFFQGYLETYCAAIDMLALAADGDAGRLADLLEQSAENAVPATFTMADRDFARVEVEEKAFSQTVGFYSMIASLLALGLSSLLIDDRKAGMYQRVKASNVGTVHYVAGMCLAGALMCGLPAAVFLGYTAVAGVSTGAGLGAVAGVTALYTLALVGLALVAGMFIQSKMGALFLLVMVSTIGNMLGGAYFPLEGAPEILQQLAKFMPPYWLMDAVSRSAAGGTVWLNAGVLTLFALLFFILAGIRFADPDERGLA